VTAQQEENDRRRLLLDDGRNTQNPPTIPFLGGQNTRRTGDTLPGLDGVLAFDFGVFRVQPTGEPNFRNENPRQPRPPGVGARNLKVASFNVLNYFNDFDDPDNPNDNACGPFADQECRGANSAAEFQRQRAKLFTALRGLDADVVGLIEVENDGDGPGSSIVDLVAGLNASLPSRDEPYAFIPDPVGYGHPGEATIPGGDDAIKVTMIHRPGRVTTVGPVAQTFHVNRSGAKLTVVINHFKSKTPGPCAGDDCDLGDGRNFFNGSRKRQAQSLLDFIAGTVVPGPAIPT
jgi:uncharacterized protein